MTADRKLQAFLTNTSDQPQGEPTQGAPPAPSPRRETHPPTGPAGGLTLLASVPSPSRTPSLEAGYDDAKGPYDHLAPPDKEIDLIQIRAVLPGLLMLAYKLLKRSPNKAQIDALADQIVDCAARNPDFAGYLEVLPMDCMVTVGLTAWLIYMEAKPNEVAHTAQGQAGGVPGSVNSGVRHGEPAGGNPGDLFGRLGKGTTATADAGGSIWDG